MAVYHFLVPTYTLCLSSVYTGKQALVVFLIPKLWKELSGFKNCILIMLLTG